MSGNLSFSALDLDYDFFPHRVTVQRSAAVGEDESGAPVEGWTTVYENLPCVVVPASAHDVVQWDQAGITASHKVTFPPLLVSGVPGTLPDIHERDRLLFGKYAGGATRYLMAQDRQDEGEQGILLTVLAMERRPG